MMMIMNALNYLEIRYVLHRERKCNEIFIIVLCFLQFHSFHEFPSHWVSYAVFGLKKETINIHTYFEYGKKISNQETLREKGRYSELFWSVFSCIRTEYREIFRISSYSVRMRENTDQNNPEYGHFLCNESRRDSIVFCFDTSFFFIAL